VEAIASRVAHRPYKWLLVTIPHVVKQISTEDGFIEEGDEVDRVRWWTSAICMAVDRVGHVRFMVWRIEVLTIPAGGEEDLGPEAAGTLVVGEAIGFGCCWPVVVQASIVDCI
jgi:hypothetical protein